MPRSLALGLTVLLFSATSLPAQQEAILGQLYGTGVHAYFGQDYRNAYTALSSAIDSGSKDPRAFYFRGLALLRLGRSEDAKLDFQKAADMEAADVNTFYNVARAIERIQGADRLLVEQYRTNARMQAWQRAETLRRARYEEIQRRETQVLRQQAELGPAATGAAPATPPMTPATPEAPAAKAAAAQEATDPFAAPTAPAAKEAAPAKVETKEAAPAGSAAKAPPVEATEEKVEAPPAPDAVANPFATPGPADAAAPAAATEATAKAPADDPFAVPAKGAEKQPAKSGDAQPAKAADAADDPFK